MKVLDHPSGYNRQPAKTVLTVGTFDGLHRGHQAIIRQVVERARAQGLASVVYTFHPHPHYVMRERSERFLLTTDAERLAVMEQLGVETVVRQEFTRSFASLPAEEFVTDIIIRFLNPALIISGFSHAFGRGGKGSPELLKRLGSKQGFGVEVVAPVLEGGEKVNSTTIRHYLKNGNLKKANAMLGRPFRLEGDVVPGKGRGRQLEMPTANIRPDSEQKLIPGDGIYTGTVERQGKPFPGLIYCGSRPTFESEEEKHVEAHLLGVDDTLYGEKVAVAFLEKLRDDRTFGSAQELAEQMAKDKAMALEFFKQTRAWA